MCLVIESLGSGLSLQDGGRSGWRRFGVPPGGAMDRQAMAAANQLLGNPPGAAVLEVVRQGARLRVQEDLWIALAGSDSCPQLPAWTARRLRAGEALAFTARAAGVFSYVAVPGGFDAPRWFGSVSVDARSGLGTPLAPGVKLTAAAEDTGVLFARQVAGRQLGPDWRRNYAEAPIFGLLPGPQFDAFSETARVALVAGPWSISTQCDRTGYRLEGPSLEVPAAISSEPVIPGSFQVPGNGQPIVTMVDGPTVGGYPKIAVLREADRNRLAQCAPGAQVVFRWADY